VTLAKNAVGGRGEAAIDATFFDRENASKSYCRPNNYRVQTLKTTALVDTDSQAVMDVHCTTEKCHDTQIGCAGCPPQRGRPAQPRRRQGYDWQELRDKLRDRAMTGRSYATNLGKRT